MQKVETNKATRFFRPPHHTGTPPNLGGEEDTEEPIIIQSSCEFSRKR